MLQLKVREFDGRRVPGDRYVAPLVISHEAARQGADGQDTHDHGTLYVLCFGIADAIVEVLALLYTMPY